MLLLSGDLFDQEEGCERNAGYLMEQMVHMTAKGLGTCYLKRAAGAEGARRQTLPDDGRIRLPGGQALP